MRETRVGMERTKFGKKRDPLQYSRVLSKGAVEPAESFFFVAKGDINCGNHRRRDVSLLPRLQELSKNISRLRLPAHARVGDGKPAAREIRCLLGFSVERDRFGEVALVAIGGRKIRIQIKVIRIEQKRPLALINCIVDAAVSQVGGGGNVASDGRHGIQLLSLQHQSKPFL